MTWLPRRFSTTRAAVPDPRDGDPPPKPDLTLLRDFALGLAVCGVFLLLGFYLGGGFLD